MILDPFRAWIAQPRDASPDGLDAVSADSAEWVPEVEPLGATVVNVLCPENRNVPEGFECPHACRPGSCAGCPAAEEG